LLSTYKEIGLEVNADKIKYIFMSRDQNAGMFYSIELGNHFEVRQFKIFGNNNDKSKWPS